MHKVTVALVFSLIASLLVAQGAGAQEEGAPAGDYNLVARWVEEPPFVGQDNTIQLVVEHLPTERPVDGLELTLSAEVVAPDATRRAALLPSRDLPGRYTSPVFLSQPGKYVFHVFGTVEGEAVEVELELQEVRFLEDIVFPEKSELINRLETAAAEAEALELQVQDRADSARFLSVAALVVATLSLVVVGAMVVYRR